PVHDWCIEFGDHEYHMDEPVRVAMDCDLGDSHRHDHTDQPYIDARLVSEDDRRTGQRGAGAAISFGDCELTADGARRELAKIRAALPRIEALADTLDGKPPYVPPTDCDEAEHVTLAGSKGAILSAYLYTPEWESKPDGPMRLSVYPEPNADDDLDLAGAIDLRDQLIAFLPKLDAMISVLAAEVPTAPPEGENAQPTDTTSGYAQ
ncbi:hypothetical protein, partial [Streptomyces sp.]|uniref:hypothetical protein n=1 Tax=Streptomyces sp. TaxID=1931 RepID=UPI002F41C6B3